MIWVLDRKSIKVFLLFLVIVTVLVLCLKLVGGKTIIQTSFNKKVVALTFDDGPNILYTPEVLRILKKNKIRATFFVVGEKVKLHPDIFRWIIKDGHEIGNHTFTHPYMDKISGVQIEREITENSKIIEGFTGHKTKWFRPPRGVYNVDILAEAEKQGYTVVLWDFCVENSAAPNGIEMTLRSLKKAKSKVVVLLHDGGLDRKETVKSLPLIIYGLKKRNYRFVTLSKLL